MTVQKFTGGYEEQLELIAETVLQHAGHVITFRLHTLEWASIHCWRCNKAVVDGSRELIEMIYLEMANRGSPA